MSDQEATATGPSYDVGSINVDSIKEVLHTLAHAFPFVDENSKNAMHAQIESLDKAGNPNAPAEEKAVADKDAEIAALRAKLAEAGIQE